MVDFQELWSGIDWFILIAYFVVIIFVGVRMRKRAGKNVKSFYAASRKLTIPIMVGVAAASWYDSWTIVGLAECGWTMGISVIFIFVIPEAVLRIPLASIIGPHVRDQLPDWIVTVPDLMDYLYSKKVKLISAFTYIANIMYDSALLFAIAEVMHLITNMNIIVSLAICGAVMIVYTALSGLWGLAITDLVQFSIMTISAGALLIGIITKFGGFDSLFDQIEAIDPLFMTPLGHNSGWEAVAWAISACAMYSEAQCYQRFGASRSGADIKVSYGIMLMMGVTFSITMVFGGMAALVEFGDVAASPAEGFWALVFSVLPTGFKGLFVAALCAAVMSTVSSDWLVFSTCAVNDIYRGFINKNLSEEKTVLGMRFAVVFFGIVCVIGTYFWADGIANAWYYLGGFLFSMFFIPITAGLFYKKKTAQGAMACIVYSASMYVIWEFILGVPFEIPTAVLVASTGAVLYFIVSNATYKGNDADKLSSKNV